MKNKLLKFFKNFTTFFVMVTLSFSNIPFNLLTGAIDGYVKTSNIVDQAWHLSQEGNVVDNFVSSYRNKNIALLDKLAGNLKINEAHAAASYVGGVTCARAGSTGTALTCSLTALTGGSNTSPSQDDIVIAVVSTGSTADRAIGVTNAGYTELPELYANGTTYDTNLSVSWKIMGATPDTAVNFSASGSTADAISAVVHVWRGVDTGTPFDVTNQSITGTGTGRPNPPPITPVTSGATVIAIGAGAAATGVVYTAAGLANFRTVASVDTNDSMTGMGSFAWSSGTYDSAQWTGGTTNAADSWASYTLALRPAVNTTTISNFVSAEPGNSTIAPNASGMVDSFGLATNAGTDTVTAATVGLAAGMGQYIQTVAITNDGDTVTYCSAAPSGDTASLSSCNVPVTTTNTQFKIKLTAKTHASMPVPAGGSYAVTATVTGWTGTNATHAGTDSGSSTLTIDNASPGGTTGAGATSGENAQSVVSWTNPGDGDFQQVYVYCKTSSMISGEAPTEGTDPVVDGTACDGTARMKYKGTASPQTFTGLTNGTTYYFRIYGRDTNGNFTAYSATQEATGTPTAPSNTLTISASAGSKVANIDSGATSQFVHNTSCTDDSTCSAFKLAASGGDVNVTSITVTESSASINADAELSNATLIYDTDANYSNGTTGTFGTDATFTSQAVTFTNAGLNIPNGSTYYFYIRTDFVNGVNNPTGGATVNFQIANTTDVVSDGTESGTATLAGTTTLLPNVTDVTNSSLVDGGRNGDTFTITGAGFGTACGSLSVAVGGLTLTCNSATNTEISATIPSTQTTTYGGASSMLVTVGGTADDASQTYYVYPNVTVPPTNDSGREASDVTVQGTRFGATQGTVQFTGAFDNPSPISASITSWSDTSITVTVPASITDTTYLGDIKVIRNSDSKTDLVYDTNGFRVLPRITSLVPSNGIVGAGVTVNGDHLCQSGTCPGSFSAANKVTFNSGVDATSWGTWSDTVIETAVPTGAITGDVVVTSNTYTSNALTFTVNANTTTLATGSDPAVNTIAPGASATDVNLFTLQTNGGTESVTSVTVNLSTNSGIGLLAITDNANTVLGSTASPVTGSNVISVAGMSAGTGVTTFKVRATPLSHAGMPAPSGASYSITAPVTAWAGTNTHAGSDTNTNALTIDNTSPAGTTGATPTAGDAQVQLSWSNPGDSDFQKVIIYCKTASISETPTEGSDPSVDGAACDATARVKYSGSSSPQLFMGLTNGTTYYFRIYARDTRGNFTVIASTQEVSAIPTLTQTLTVGTVGTQATNLNSGSTAQHIGGAGTAAFTLQINTGSSNVTSVKVSETIAGFAIANLTNAKLYYENAVNAASCAYGGAESFVSGAAPVGETITFTLPSVAIGVAANVTCLYFVSDVSSSAVGGQTIELQISNPSTDVVVSAGVNDDTIAKAIGTTTIRPNVTDVTNSPLVDGGRNGETFTITGAGFGIACGSLSVAVGGLTLTCNSATNTEISATIPSTQTTTYGGASSMLVTVGGTEDDASQTYYVYPNVTVPPTNDSGREASDVTIQGTRFGATQGTVQFTKAFDNPSPINAAIASWSDTSITVTVPASITDTTYLGEINVIRNSDSKPDLVYNDVNGFRVLPRITGLVNSSDSVGQPITINGNHLCQSGTCPLVFSSANKVTFNVGVEATAFTSWSDAVIITEIPTGTVTGDVVVTSDTSYTSNGSTFTLADATPTNPANEKQARNSGITDLISAGGYASSTPVYFSLDTSSSVSGGTMYAQIELRPTTGANSSFTSVCAANPYCFETSGGLSYTSGSITVTASTTSITDDVHHWQARVRYNKSGTDYYSGWVAYSDPAFRFDTINPVVTFTGADSCTTAVDNLGTNGARISWSFTPPSDVADGQVEYSTSSDLSGSTLSPIPPSAQSSNHAITLSNLNSNTPYYFKVRSRDTAGNLGTRPSVSPYCSFTTSSNLFPAKTTRFHIVGDINLVTNGSPGQYQFYATTTETNISQKSAFVTLTGIYETTNVTPTNSQVTVQYESEADNNIYTLPGGPVAGTFRGYFKIVRKVNTVNTASVSTLTVTPDAGTTLYVNSADLIMTYSYTP